ncbi:MAG: hypothetical protein A2V90_07850 [Gammaproteobacteria bacterium RBG_16_57_12]|nr:MAG: hypothetical protein A2V90_07850 [Gammaproteobacteria bacterium RBG_16_57_12]
MPIHRLWYIRSEKGQVEGPFPVRLIGDFVLVGRLTQDHEVSHDRNEWKKLRDVPELVPQELKQDLSKTEAQQQLTLARRRADARSRQDRRATEPEGAMAEERRDAADRRIPEPYQTNVHRTRQREAFAPGARAIALPGPKILLGLAVLLVLVTALFFILQPIRSAQDSDCNARPMPGVYWENCKMEGRSLSGVNLSEAHLRNSYLAMVILNDANLERADLSYSNLSGASLSNAKLYNANLVGVTLRKANLQGAKLKGANMSYAILQGADLSNAMLWNVDLSNADLQGANLQAADLYNARLDNAIWVDGRVCQTGSVSKCLTR